MKSFLAAAAAAGAILLSGEIPASAGADVCQLLPHCRPPAEYASGPFRARPVVRTASAAQVTAWCNGGREALADEDMALGCAEVGGSVCTVYIANNVRRASPELYGVILAHELAHCRGWDHH